MKTNKGDRTGVSNNTVKRGIDFRIIACDHLFSIQFLILLAFYITLHACITKYKTHYKNNNFELHSVFAISYGIARHSKLQKTQLQECSNSTKKTCVWNMRKWNQNYRHLVILGRKDWRINRYSLDIGPLRMHVILALSFPSKFIASCHACFSYHEPLTEA